MDSILLAPATVLTIWLNGQDRTMFYKTLVPSFALSVFFHVYCVARWGGSPGKLVCGLRIVKTSLDPAGWREAWLRYSVQMLLGIVFLWVYAYALEQMSDSEFVSLGFMERTRKLGDLGGSAQIAVSWMNGIWTWGEFIVLLTNHQRRAIHDFMAGTLVIVKPRDV